MHQPGPWPQCVSHAAVGGELVRSASKTAHLRTCCLRHNSLKAVTLHQLIAASSLCLVLSKLEAEDARRRGKQRWALTWGLWLQKEALQWQAQLQAAQAQLDRLHVMQQQEGIAEEMLHQLQAACSLDQPYQRLAHANSVLSGELTPPENLQW